ncbi:MAG: MFS transporter, partial [Deltaproteobacteria bacterium]|nr:MFS transporter [Deltaproteobacteria bacterium]
NIPVGLIAIGLIRFGYRIPTRRVEHRVDVMGALLLLGSVGSLVLYTSWAGSSWGFGSPPALGLLAMSGLLAIGFSVQERRASEPIIELSLLRMRAIWPPLLTTCVFGFGNLSIAILLPLFTIVVSGSSAIEAGLGLMPLTFGLFASALVVGRLAAATQRYRRYVVRGLVLYIIGLALLSTMGPETPRLVFWFYSLLLVLGSGTISPMVIASLQNAVHERYLGLVSSLPGFSRAVAQTIGTSILGAFLGLRIVQHLETLATPLMAAGESLDQFIKSPDAIRALAEPLHSAVVESYRMAFSETFSLMIGIMALSLCAACFIRDTRIE